MLQRLLSPGRSVTKPPGGQVAAAATLVAVFAFALYRATLVPGLDLGDTSSLQVTVGSPIITPRDGYPLYFAIGDLLYWMLGGDPARTLNLASAVQAATACAFVVLAGVELSGSILAAVAAALLFAGSYTFWSQSVLAEVYALHAMFVALTLWLLFRWERQPSTASLALVLACYALGFGNHLSMILLAPALAWHLLLTAPGGWRTMVTARTVALAAACAAGGALLYAWNIRALWLLPYPPATLTEALARFWFDVTKSDWRETMVMTFPRSMLADRAVMYAFDVTQQFGVIPPLLAVAGLVSLTTTNWRRAVLMLVLYAVNAAFALGYNVGDAHVFFIPSHLLIALLAAPGIVLTGRLLRQPHLPSLALIAYAAVRIHHDYPALDRSRDTRPVRVLEQLTAGLHERDEILLTEVNWELQNGLFYFLNRLHPEVASARMADVVLYVPRLVADNAAIGRSVVLTERAHNTLEAAYGPLLPTSRDPRVSTPSLASRIDTLPTGTRYVFTVLKPTREFKVSWEDLGLALVKAGDGTPVAVPDGDYVVIAGMRGRRPALLTGANAPFRRSLDLDGLDVEIRMDSWLASDTIRRMGFGHVIASRQHALIVERGISFVAMDPAGRPIETAYASNIYEPQARYLIGQR